MNSQQEFMSETFHTLAQPITALRATVELGLRKVADTEAAHQILADCLRWIDRLMQDLAVLREIANLEDKPPVDSCDGQALLQSLVQEMAPVAQASGIALHLNAEPGGIFCHAPMFQQAVFLLLDQIIAGTGRDRTISISLHRREDGFLLAIHPGTPPGPRHKLCCKLMHFAGGRVVDFATDSLSITFRESASRPSPATVIADKTFLMSH